MFIKPSSLPLPLPTNSWLYFCIYSYSWVMTIAIIDIHVNILLKIYYYSKMWILILIIYRWVRAKENMHAVSYTVPKVFWAGGDTGKFPFLEVWLNKFTIIYAGITGQQAIGSHWGIMWACRLDIWVCCIKFSGTLNNPSAQNSDIIMIFGM